MGYPFQPISTYFCINFHYYCHYHQKIVAIAITKLLRSSSLNCCERYHFFACKKVVLFGHRWPALDHQISMRKVGLGIYCLPSVSNTLSSQVAH